MTLPLKVQIPGCSPIRRASGTHDPVMRKKLIRMVHTLHEQGRDDLVNAIAAGRLKPLQVYSQYRFSRLDDLPHADELPLFRDTWRPWLAAMDISDDHRTSIRVYFQRFEAAMPRDATAGQIVDALRVYRERHRQHPRTANIAKSHVQSFLRDLLGKRHRAYLNALDVPTLRVTAKRARHPMTPERLKEVVRQLGEPYGPIAWSMATTGMGWKEYKGKWQREGYGLRIHGTKAKGRDRLIPLVSWIVPPSGALLTYRRRLKQFGLTPYDMRRTFAGLMVEAGIPRPRRIAYMGHSASDVTDLYEQMEVREYLQRDAERMRNVLGEPPDGPTIRLVQEA
jgi:integrase